MALAGVSNIIISFVSVNLWPGVFLSAFRPSEYPAQRKCSGICSQWPDLRNSASHSALDRMGRSISFRIGGNGPPENSLPQPVIQPILPGEYDHLSVKNAPDIETIT